MKRNNGIWASAGAGAFVLALPDIDPARASEAGGKATNLARMIRAGWPVPPGFCITTAAFRRFVAGVEGGDSLYAGMENLESVAVEQAQVAAARVRERLAALPVPGEVEAEVVSAWQSHGAERAYAVRSSATAEDLPNASFAGQQDTFLNVRGRAAILDAVRCCWISLFTDRAVLYRMKNRISHRSVAMAVVVQEMVRAEAAGVLFTADPVTGDTGRIVIEGTYGLGEALVSGKVNPDRWALEKDTLRVSERQANRKTVEIVLDEAGGVRERSILAARQNELCLSEAMVRRLGELACKAERLFGGPQDMEWAIGDGRIWLLQSRPITTLHQPAEEDRTVWSNLAVGEVMPDVATPMTWSVLELVLKGFINPTVRRLGMDLEKKPWLGLIAGRVYLNMTTVAEIFRSLPFLANVELDEALGGHQGRMGIAIPANPTSGQRSLNIRRRVRLLGLMVWFLVHSTNRSGAAFIAELRRRLDELACADVSSMPDEELARFIPGLFSRAYRGADDAPFEAAALGCAGGGFGCVMVLFRLSRKWLGDADGSLANRLISGAGGMDSAESALDLWRLAAWARQHSLVTQVLQEPGSFAAADKRLEATPAGQEFLGRWRGFMARHGHHSRGEVDVHNPRWSETPDYVLDMVRSYLRVSETADPLKLQAGRLRQRQQLMADCQRRLRHPLKRWAFNFLLRKGQRGLAVRENGKSECVRMLGLMRRALLEAGRRLAERGILREGDDVFFLNLTELGPVLAGRVEFDVPVTIAERKAEFARNLSLTPPPVIVGRFDPDRSIPIAIDETAKLLKGLAVSPGVVTGRARVILRADAEARVLPGEILVAPFTDPGWTPYFLPAAAIVVDLGGQLTHGSVVAREYGIPAVVNVGSATRIIRTGQVIQVDGNRGVVTILSEGEEQAEAIPLTAAGAQRGMDGA